MENYATTIERFMDTVLYVGFYTSTETLNEMIK